jgi:hypothetical protein
MVLARIPSPRLELNSGKTDRPERRQDPPAFAKATADESGDYRTLRRIQKLDGSRQEYLYRPVVVERWTEFEGSGTLTPPPPSPFSHEPSKRARGNV